MPSTLWKRQLDSYKGLVMRCAPGTHEAAIKMLHSRHPAPGPALDLAAGSGALVARLSDAGYTDLTAVELDTGKFGFPGVTPQAIDLNGDFAAKLNRKFSLVTALEIIEHLNSPRDFLTQIRNLLTDDGLLLLSTPNIAEWMGRIKFCLTGVLRHFDDGQYRFTHHVSPLPDLQLRHMTEEIGLRVVDYTTAGSFLGSLKHAAMFPFWLPFRITQGPNVLGDVNLYLMTKTDPQKTAIGDWTA